MRKSVEEFLKWNKDTNNLVFGNIIHGFDYDSFNNESMKINELESVRINQLSYYNSHYRISYFILNPVKSKKLFMYFYKDNGLLIAITSNILTSEHILGDFFRVELTDFSDESLNSLMKNYPGIQYDESRGLGESILNTSYDISSIKEYIPFGLYTPEWKKLSSRFKATLFDRSRTINTGLSAKVLRPIPKDTYTSKSLEQIIDERVNDFDYPTILFSGGLDSTTVLSAFIKNKKPCRVTYNDNSIKEYPKMFMNLMNKKYEFIDLVHLSEIDLDEEQFTSGECGDQMYGSALMLPYIVEGTLQNSYKYIKEFEITEDMEILFKNAPVKIETVYDAVWWINFTLKYQDVQTRMHRNGFIVGKNINHFFDTDDFDRWTITNHKVNRLVNSLTTHKSHFREYIMKSIHDLDYVTNKTKVPSLMRWKDI